MIRNSEVLIKAFIFDNRHQKKKRILKSKKWLEKTEKMINMMLYFLL